MTLRNYLSLGVLLSLTVLQTITAVSEANIQRRPDARQLQSEHKRRLQQILRQRRTQATGVDNTSRPRVFPAKKADDMLETGIVEKNQDMLDTHEPAARMYDSADLEGIKKQHMDAMDTMIMSDKDGHEDIVAKAKDLVTEGYGRRRLVTGSETDHKQRTHEVLQQPDPETLAGLFTTDGDDASAADVAADKTTSLRGRAQDTQQQTMQQQQQEKDDQVDAPVVPTAMDTPNGKMMIPGQSGLFGGLHTAIRNGANQYQQEYAASQAAQNTLAPTVAPTATIIFETLFPTAAPVDSTSGPTATVVEVTATTNSMNVYAGGVQDQCYRCHSLFPCEEVPTGMLTLGLEDEGEAAALGSDRLSSPENDGVVTTGTGLGELLGLLAQEREGGTTEANGGEGAGEEETLVSLAPPVAASTEFPSTSPSNSPSFRVDG